MKSNKTAIKPTRAENYPEWYQQIIKAADLAEVSPVRGCMIIKPWGYAIWENIQRVLDEKFKATGHKNLYFPLMIPLSFMQKEAEHIEGFAKECAVVTHSRLAVNEEGKLTPANPLEEAYIIRPTSETLIGDAFSRWIQSYRDLPVLVNQWANIVRWEMRTRMFLRTTEFLWQEGHTAHATSEEAMQETHAMLDVYAQFAEEYLAMPVIKGEKTASERFPGADNTYCIEAMMQDKKALQAGTSHFLGQHFSKSFNIKYLSAAGKEEFVSTTSWGVSTRLIGGLIMTHSDDNGLVLPPKIAPSHVVILPIIHDDADRESILTYCDKLASELRELRYHGRQLGVEIDTRDLPGGEKAWSWVKKGIPIRLEIGKREMAAQQVSMSRRDKDYKDRQALSHNEIVKIIDAELDDIEAHLFLRAQTFQQENTQTITNFDDFCRFFEGDGGFALTYWNGDAAIEAEMKQKLGVTIRCLPLDKADMRGKCIFSGQANARMVIFAKAY
ncbi:MAG: proline--tRNA ligase [Gammaproteobacteria bacterium RIFCSPHIGHO2_12_FULL_43_28]|nr:MAG: proline--tRNA ligase [Gammaproteobacteria bacterium RIFCSPHIGHO2_12_FULL_43_28]